MRIYLPEDERDAPVVSPRHDRRGELLGASDALLYGACYDRVGLCEGQEEAQAIGPRGPGTPPSITHFDER